MPRKRPFAEFTADLEYKQYADHVQSHIRFPTPPASTSTLSDTVRKDHSTFTTVPPPASSRPSLLRRCVSLPTLDQLRKLSPFKRLTAENLRAMDPGNPPLTPDRTTSGSRKSKSSSGVATADEGWKMGLIGLLDPYVGEQRLERRPDLQAAVMQTVGGSRASCAKSDSVRGFRDMLLQMRTRNEATAAARLMPFLIKKERTVQPEGVDDPSLLAGSETVREELRAFELDHLDWSIDKEFIRSSVPHQSTEGTPSSFGIKNPKPDITYGFQRAAFSPELQRTLDSFEPEISGGIVSPFLVVEWKGFNGSITVGKDQARRSGAAMVYSRRQAVSRLPPSTSTSTTPFDEPSNISKDLDTIAFTCVLNLELVHIHVHWAEEVDGRTEWLMAVVKRFHPGEPADFMELRRCLHNILDWGLTQRLDTVRRGAAEWRVASTGAGADGSESRGRGGQGDGKRRRVDSVGPVERV